MGTSIIATHNDKTIEITMTVPWKDIQAAYDKTVDELVKDIEVKGFRKGKAPRDIAEKELDKNKVYEAVIRELIPELYQAAVTKHKIAPIMNPDITPSKAKEQEDWEIKAFTCELPEIKADNYKVIAQKAKGELKKDDLWLPGKEEKQDDKDLQAKKQKSISAILEALMKEIEMVIPAILVKSETDRRLTSLLDDITKLGLTTDTYAKSKNTTPAQIRTTIEKEVVNTYKIEFILEYIADAEKIVVSEKEIQDIIDKTESSKEKKQLENSKYYLANMVKRQKTLDTLVNL